MKLPESREDDDLQNPPRFSVGLRNMCAMLGLAALVLLQMGWPWAGSPQCTYDGEGSVYFEDLWVTISWHP